MSYICQKCSKEVFVKFGSGRFCSRACANARERSPEVKQKISNSLLLATASTAKHSALNKRYCISCGKLLSTRNVSGLCYNCNLSSDLVRERRVEAGKKAYATMQANGTHHPWQSRTIKSYAESFWEQVLLNNNILFKREVPIVHEKSNYFLDFLIDVGVYKLDLEIDGKQHRYKERIESDALRDEYLRNLGYVVYRIAWNEINSIEGKQKMQEKVEAFIKFYNKCLV